MEGIHRRGYGAHLCDYTTYRARNLGAGESESGHRASIGADLCSIVSRTPPYRGRSATASLAAGRPELSPSPGSPSQGTSLKLSEKGFEQRYKREFAQCNHTPSATIPGAISYYA